MHRIAFGMTSQSLYWPRKLHWIIWHTISHRWLWMLTKSTLKISLPSVKLEKFTSINLWGGQSSHFKCSTMNGPSISLYRWISQSYGTATKLLGLNLIAFISTYEKVHLKLSSAKYLLRVISLKWTLVTVCWQHTKHWLRVTLPHNPAFLDKVSYLSPRSFHNLELLYPE